MDNRKSMRWSVNILNSTLSEATIRNDLGIKEKVTYIYLLIFITDKKLDVINKKNFNYYKIITIKLPMVIVGIDTSQLPIISPEISYRP